MTNVGVGTAFFVYFKCKYSLRTSFFHFLAFCKYNDPTHTKVGCVVVIACPGLVSDLGSLLFKMWTSQIWLLLHTLLLLLFIFPMRRVVSKTLPFCGPVYLVCSTTAELLLSMRMSEDAQSFSRRSSLLGFSLVPQSLPSWAKVVPSNMLQRNCPSHDLKKSCLMFWEDYPKLCVLIGVWKTLSLVTDLRPVKFNGKTAYAQNTAWMSWTSGILLSLSDPWTSTFAVGVKYLHTKGWMYKVFRIS